jgi:hypothetical protein
MNYKRYFQSANTKGISFKNAFDTLKQLLRVVFDEEEDALFDTVASYKY